MSHVIVVRQSIISLLIENLKKGDMRYTSHFGVIKLFNFEFISFQGSKKLKGGSIPESVCVG